MSFRKASLRLALCRTWWRWRPLGECASLHCLLGCPWELPFFRSCPLMTTVEAEGKVRWQSDLTPSLRMACCSRHFEHELQTESLQVCPGCFLSLPERVESLTRDRSKLGTGTAGTLRNNPFQVTHMFCYLSFLPGLFTSFLSFSSELLTSLENLLGPESHTSYDAVGWRWLLRH
jgi:hypothetical protein